PPDPGSMSIATIGGHVGENAGGPHCLKYGVTANHVMGLEVVLPNGDIIETGGYVEDTPGYDLTGLLIGSEGTMGIVTRVIVRISPMPEETVTVLALLNSAWDSAEIVSEIIRSGLNPSVLEMVEGRMLEECNDLFKLEYPESVTAQLIIEVDGEKEGIPFELEAIMDICRKHNAQYLKIAESAEEREKLWVARRGTTAALGRLKPDSAENDIVVPRSQLPRLVEKLKEIGIRNGVILGVVIHAGDGNAHPQVPFDGKNPAEERAAHQALWEAFEAAVELGGTISGEHGIGLEKIEGMRLIFSPDELLLMRRLKLVFDPQEVLNADKMFPRDIIELAREATS
ncbi:MAG TPA: FAD-linked oxidase C-terminal domain-containing protein, partial [Syntrophomonas sp.]|nr:FAD-linked oxidase C-terminal domain-containing protein [Syntrophomonas sp.]